MARIRHALRRFFFPPPGTKLSIRLLPYITLGLLTLLLLVGGAYAWDYTNSPPFCGQTCHTMPPEYTAYLTSPHARIDCVDCHIGRGFIATRISRKAGDLEHVFDTAFHNYEFPIRARKLRPARETCERCHSPQKFSDDSLRQFLHYQQDSANTAETTYLVLKTGGGSKREGLGRGIHWHIENQVFFLPTDDHEQTIPYVRVVEEDGTVVEYADISADIDTASIEDSQLKLMDCITCHNRITHLIYPPDDTVDILMTRGLVSSAIPEIKKRAVEVYAASSADVASGLEEIARLRDFYTQTYPDFVSEHPGLVDDAIAALQDSYRKSHFPEQKVDWTTHPNNIGHQDTGGCFRCHDGKHLNAAGEAIRLECNLCHAIPVVAGPPDFVANIELSRGIEPQSHLNANWITLHREVFDSTCASCHSTDDPGGISNSSFCSNSACHGNVWEYAGFDAPGLRDILLAQLPPASTPTPLPSSTALTFQDGIGPILQQRCVACHGPDGIQGLNLSSYEGVMKGSVNGPIVLTGDSAGSRLIEVQSGPQNHFGQLTPEEFRLVSQWIDSGAPEN